MDTGNKRFWSPLGLYLVVALVAPSIAVERKQVQNVVLVGWDGTRRENLERLLLKGKLPHLQELITEGSMVHTEVTTGATETKPGWTEILTGISADSLGIEDNDHYRPIPKGLTLFERLKSRFKDKLTTIFVVGKINNLGFRGPHEICINCFSRRPGDHLKTMYWDRKLAGPDIGTFCGLPQRWVKRDGEPYFYSVQAVDWHKPGLGPADNVGKEALAALEKFRGARFFAFFHFEDPDEQGHQHGEGSQQYDDAIIAVDAWLGQIVEKMKQLGIYDKTALLVTTDHGMDEGRKSHHCAPDTFVATDVKAPLRDGDRKDVAPTVIDLFGIDPTGLDPKLDGHPLWASGL